jgi:hypothetical protein
LGEGSGAIQYANTATKKAMNAGQSCDRSFIPEQFFQCGMK